MKQVIQYMDKVCGNKWFPVLFIIIAFIFILLFSKTTSLIYNIEFGDSAVFKMMGHVILQGGIPYVDFFDHKGPILYFINALGEFISPEWGLFALQVLVNSLAMILWFYIAKLFIRPTYSFIATLLAIFFYIGVYEYGNLTEEWSILPSSLALYLGLSYFVKYTEKPHSYWRSLIYGLCFGTMFFIRPNDAVMIVGGIMTGIFIYILIKRKEYKNAILNALTFLGGFIIITTPLIIYFACHHALYDFYYGLLGFNIKYSGGILHNIFNYRFTIGLMSLCALPIILAYSADQKPFLWVLIPIITLVLLFFGRNGFPHYYMTLIPSCFLITLTLLFKQKSIASTIFCSILLLMLSNIFGGTSEKFQYADLAFTQVKSQCKAILKGQFIHRSNADLEESNKLFSLIPTLELDSIWNYSDTFAGRFYYAGIIAQNPIPPIIAAQYGYLTNEQSQQIDIGENKPLWVFFVDNSKSWEQQYILPTDSAFLCDNYEVVVRADTTISNCCLLRRKN